MGKLLTVYLFTTALAEAFILLLARGTARNHLEYWEYVQPHKVSAEAAAAPQWATAGLFFPLVLVVLAGLRMARQVKSDRISVHALGLSILAVAFLSSVSIAMSMTPALLDLRHIGERTNPSLESVEETL